MGSTTISIFLIFSILPFLHFVQANNDGNIDPSSFRCPPPPPCICSPTSPPTLPPVSQPPPPPETSTLPSPPTPPSVTSQPPLPQTTPPPPLETTPTPPPVVISPLPSGICSKNATELQICANILRTSDANLNAGRAEPCCFIIRNLSDIDAVTCLCQSVREPRFSLSPNFNIFFKTCGRRIPQGFSCPGPSPTSPPLPLPPPTTTQSPPPAMTSPPPPAMTPSQGAICLKNATELQTCANILRTSDANLNAGRAEPCCSIIRNLSDIDAVTCLCKSVGEPRFSLSPNFNIFFRTCGRRIPQGFSCPGPSTTPPPPQGAICSKNATELKICANILRTSDANLSAGRAEPCCSIVRNLSDVDAVTCLCTSVGEPRFSLSPNFNIFFRTCGRRIPQGFSCPGPSTTPPPPTVMTTPLPPMMPPPPPPPALQGAICSKNTTELKICANILRTSDANLSAGRAEPCCSIVRNLSDVDAVTCLCNSVGEPRFSLSPNFNIFFKTCGRRIPQGFSCP